MDEHTFSPFDRIVFIIVVAHTSVYTGRSKCCLTKMIQGLYYASSMLFPISICNTKFESPCMYSARYTLYYNGNETIATSNYKCYCTRSLLIQKKKKTGMRVIQICNSEQPNQQFRIQTFRTIIYINQILAHCAHFGRTYIQLYNLKTRLKL